MNILNELPFEFYGERFTIYYTDDGHFWLPLNRLCEALGIDHRGQRQRISRSKVLSRHITELAIDTPYQGVNRIQPALVLDAKRLPYWLGTLETSRLRPEIQEMIVNTSPSTMPMAVFSRPHIVDGVPDL